MVSFVSHEGEGDWIPSLIEGWTMLSCEAIDRPMGKDSGGPGSLGHYPIFVESPHPKDQILVSIHREVVDAGRWDCLTSSYTGDVHYESRWRLQE